MPEVKLLQALMTLAPLRTRAQGRSSAAEPQALKAVPAQAALPGVDVGGDQRDDDSVEQGLFVVEEAECLGGAAERPGSGETAGGGRGVTSVGQGTEELG
ncbi:hypothetical protein [Streptomyces californicus]|uniref:hypothetical protein n=1 Tax=Streptomyces californicus TaxID=67351 RepID=UPI00382B28B1